MACEWGHTGEKEPPGLEVAMGLGARSQVGFRSPGTGIDGETVADVFSAMRHFGLCCSGKFSWDCILDLVLCFELIEL